MFSFLSFLSPVFAVLKAIPLKVWLYLALILAYPLCYLIGHHRGYAQGQDHCIANYEKQANEQREQKQKDDAKNKQQAVLDESDLSKKLAQSESSKQQLQQKLKDALSKKSTPVAGCPVVDPADLQLLQADVSNANK